MILHPPRKWGNSGGRNGRENARNARRGGRESDCLFWRPPGARAGRARGPFNKCIFWSPFSTASCRGPCNSLRSKFARRTRGGQNMPQFSFPRFGGCARGGGKSGISGIPLFHKIQLFTILGFFGNLSPRISNKKSTILKKWHKPSIFFYSG